MSKYQPLSTRLSGHEGDEWRATFSDLEQVLGFPLPKGARTGRTWWANDADKSHSRSWAGQGWHVGDIDPMAETVVFRRSAASAATIQQVAQLQPLAEGVAVEGLDREATLAPQAAPSVSADSGAGDVPVASARALTVTDEPAAGALKLNKHLVGGLVAGGVALVAGLGALAVRRLVRR